MALCSAPIALQRFHGCMPTSHARAHLAWLGGLPACLQVSASMAAAATESEAEESDFSQQLERVGLEEG